LMAFVALVSAAVFLGAGGSLSGPWSSDGARMSVTQLQSARK